MHGDIRINSLSSQGKKQQVNKTGTEAAKNLFPSSEQHRNISDAI